MKWLLSSLVASVALTLLLNAAIRLWPGAAQRGERQLNDWSQRRHADEIGPGERRVRVIVPWKAMIVASIGLTILLNVVIRLL